MERGQGGAGWSVGGGRGGRGLGAAGGGGGARQGFAISCRILQN
eukprot:COSAG01_NODE_71117_length_257_cov_0.303797_1_plen_43_part_10